MIDVDFASPFLTQDDLDRLCLRDDRDEAITYGALRDRAADYSTAMAGSKSLVFLYARNDIASVAALLGAFAAGHAVALLDPELSTEPREALTARYRPEWVVGAEASGELDRRQGGGGEVNPALALLLSTSGSTGSPKFVRLSLEALESNARAIASTLEIASEDVAAAHLPIHYSFGLSVLTSHLIAGASLRLTESGFTDRGFWSAMKEASVTHLPGVPFHFQMMQKLRYERLGLTQLKCLAQAGGHLDVGARRAAHDFMNARGGRFYVMYGQTEASPRLTTLPHAQFLEAPASVGVALPGGLLEIVNPDERGQGEVVYHGPNVMLGYAEERADLARGDDNRGRLETGDIGYLDEAGRLTLMGRSKRFGKVYGLRVNLDEVEKLTNELCESVVTQKADVLRIHYVASDADRSLEQALVDRLSARYRIPVMGYEIRPIGTIPRSERGKIDYKAVESLQHD